MATPIVAPVAQQISLLSAIIALAAYVGAKLHLSSTQINPTQQNVLADFTEVVFTGYSAQTLTWGAPFVDTDQNAYLLSSVANFLQTAITATDTAFSWYLTDSASAVLLACGALDGAPINFGAVNDGMSGVLKMGYSPTLGSQITL